MKRFTETAKWDDPWFRRLSPELKNLWQWLLDHCDNAGVIEIDIDLASFQIGYQYPSDSLLKLGDRVVEIARGKHFIPKFINFQCGILSDTCPAHRPIFNSLKKHFPLGYPKGIHTLQEKEREEEEEKDHSEGSPEGNQKPAIQSPTLPEVKPTGRVFPDHSATIATIARINALRPEWAKPSHWSAAEMHALHDALAGISELEADDWRLLTKYLAAKVDPAAGYWQPRSRCKFLESFPDVFAGAQRWAGKTGNVEKPKPTGGIWK